jgi:predicted alpha/beta superfamily hydrolase
MTKFYLTLLLFSTIAFSQVTIKITAFPTTTKADDILYFAGIANDWNPLDPNSKFEKTDSYYQIVIPENTGSMEYKITRGGWDNVETSASGADITNRTFSFSGIPQTIEISVENWNGASPSTASSNVIILDENFSVPQLNSTRKVWLYLPPDYDTSSKQYPVLYMHDAQNLFDVKTSFSGEWGIDETLNDLHSKGDYGAIVVGIDNGGASRLDDYSPWNNPQYGGGKGDDYIEFLKNTLKPYIDANYRTLTDAKYTVLIGSSMGGLISTYGALKYPTTFGKVGALSPAYWFAYNDLKLFIDTNTADISSLKLYHLAGLNESETMVSNAKEIGNLLKSNGLKSSEYDQKYDSDGAHSGWYWNREFGEVYKWLFNDENLSVSKFSGKSTSLIKANSTGTVLLESKTYEPLVRLYNLNGQLIKKVKLQEC